MLTIPRFHIKVMKHLKVDLKYREYKLLPWRSLCVSYAKSYALTSLREWSVPDFGSQHTITIYREALCVCLLYRGDDYYKHAQSLDLKIDRLLVQLRPK